MSNRFKDTPAIITAREGLHSAVIMSTQHVGVKNTKYGPKDMQNFVFRVVQFDDDNNRQEADIHQPLTRSLHPDSTLVKLMRALSMPVHRGQEIDFDNFVGRKVQVVVRHKVDGKVTRANLEFVPPPQLKPLTSG